MHLRTVCDFYYYCAVQVRKGSHPNLSIDLNKPLGCSIARLLVSRGPKTTDRQMAEAVLSNSPVLFSKACAEERIKELEEDRSPMVREAAVCARRDSADSPCQMRLPPEGAATQQ